MENVTPPYSFNHRATRGIPTTPSPYGFRVIIPALVRVIDPSPHYTLVRSISRIVKVRRGIKLGHLPVPAGTLPHIPRYFPLAGTGRLYRCVGTARTPVRLQGLIPRSATPTNRSYNGERVFPKSQVCNCRCSQVFNCRCGSERSGE